ncbi:MAG: phosphatidylserine decarboxylase [Planctomycetes bacterium]|nr:phosphatidylserine decarboxylase [Planctomycetota bacterium]
MNDSPPHAMGSVQPGGGAGALLARVFGRVRRAWLRTFRPGYVAAMARRRVRACPRCVHDVVDGRDLVWVQNVCGVRFPPEDTVSPFRDRFGLVRLGRPELLLAACASVLLGFGLACVSTWLLAAGLVPLAFTAWFLRDPDRRPPAAPDVVLAPADGVLDDVREEPVSPFGTGPALRIGIYLSVFDVHVQRAPSAGRIVSSTYHPGPCVPTWRRGQTDGNAHTRTTWADAVGRVVQVRQIAGPFASRVVSVVRVGDELAAGERFGMIKFGSRCELWLPVAQAARLLVQRGQRVRAGETVLLVSATVPEPAQVPAGGNVPMQCSVTTSPRSK